jgi:uncharacterized protein YfaP (DUF2135 family)
MHDYSYERYWVRLAIGLSVGGIALMGCKQTHDVLDTDITGRVLDNRGEPVDGVTVRLFGLLDNTNFVEGSDIRSAEAYIDREAVLASRDTVATGQTGADGRFKLAAIPNAFLAVAVKDDCSPSFAGFDDATGVLNLDTLLTPNLSGGLNFEIPNFAVACAAPPEVNADGNGPDAPAFDPPPATVSCDAVGCGAAGGTCTADTCVSTCIAETCVAAGGSCVAGDCVTPACTAAACEAEGGACNAEATHCILPACTSDDDCQAGQPGAFCEHPGDVALAACHAPLPAEIIPPVVAEGWTSCRVTDSGGALLADASAEGAIVTAAAIPEDGVVRVYGDYGGSATKVYVQVQSGGSSCANFPPRTDYIAVNVVAGKIATDKGEYLELALHGGYQRIQLTTSDSLGVGDRSFVVQFGEPCAAPAHPFTAILTWDAGVGEPADLDLSVWNGAGKVLCVGSKQSGWGRLRDGKSPGPEVFESDDVSQGPFTIKVQFFCGRPRAIPGKVRIIRTVGGQVVDETYAFSVDRPKVVAEIGVFAGE